MCIRDSIQNEYFNFLTFLQNLSGLGNSAPAHFGNVNQAIYAAQINECAEVCQSGNSTCNLGANCDCFKQSCLLDVYKRQVNPGVNTAFRIGQTLDMPCAQLLFHRINLIL